MTSLRIWIPVGLLVGTLLGLGCGRTASLGQVRPEGRGGTSGEGGASSPGGTSGDCCASGNGGASGRLGEGGASGAPDAAGTAGAASAGAAGRGTAGAAASDAGIACHLPKPIPIPNPTPEDLERARLIHDYCAALARDNCWNKGGSSSVGEQTKGCSVEERITACEQDTLYEYVYGILPACNSQWQAAIKCLAAATHIPCEGAGLGDWPTRSCSAEKEALEDCKGNSHPAQVVRGSRTSCVYGIGRHSPCSVSCAIGNYFFTTGCDGPPGLPLACYCIANFRARSGGYWDSSEFYASDCREAAQAAADGAWCTNSLDCCIEWSNNGTKVCACGSDNGSCEARAQERAGTIVTLCPQYVQ